MSAEQRIKELGIKLPQVTNPIGAYIPATRSGNLVFTSGQIPLAQGELKFKGVVGSDLTVEQGYEAARLCALNGLAAIRDLIGSLDHIKRVVKVVGFVNSAPGFEAHPKVINGASDLLVEILGDAGRHVRSAVGSPGLPIGAAVEVEFTVEVS